MSKLGYEYSPEETILLIDSSTLSLKAILRHNSNYHSAVPLTYGIHIKETYVNMNNPLNTIYYHSWKVCADIKVIGILLGLQRNTNYCCF